MHDPDAIILRIERLPLRRDVGEGDFGGSGSTGGHSPLSEPAGRARWRRRDFLTGSIYDRGIRGLTRNTGREKETRRGA